MSVAPAKCSQQRYARVLIVVALAFIDAAAHAQSIAPSQIAPGDAATLARQKPIFRFPAQQGLKPPAGSEDIRLTIRDLQIESELPETITPKSDQGLIIGQEVTAADIYHFASALQDIALSRGYPLVRVIIPPQDFDPVNGTMRIRIISGFVERIDVSALPRRVRRVVAKAVSPLVGVNALQAHDLERRLVIASDTAGLDLRSTLSPGSVAGATILLLTGQHRPAQGALSVDNRQGSALGGAQNTLSLAANSMLGLGEQVVVTLAAPVLDIDWSRGLRRYAALSFGLPIGRNGLKFGGMILFSASRPEISSQLALPIESEYHRASLYLAYPVLLTRRARMTAQVSIETGLEETATTLLGPKIPLSRDKTRVIKAEVAGSHPLPRGARAEYVVEYARGFGGFGARTARDASVLLPLSRFGADARFNRASADASLTIPLKGPFSSHLLLRGETGFGDPLLRSMQESFATPDLISGLEGGSGAGDDLYGGRLELRGDWSVNTVRVAPYAFGAWAKAHLALPLANEAAATVARSAGAGLRLTLPLQPTVPIFLNLEWSRTNRIGLNPASSRVRSSVGLRF